MSSSVFTKGKPHVLRQIVAKTYRISPRFWVCCFLCALLKSGESLSRIVFPALLLDAITTGFLWERIVLWGSLCVFVPICLSAVHTFVMMAMENCAQYIEDELELSIDQTNMQICYADFDSPEMHAIFQEIKDGQNMVGPVTGVIKNHVLIIVQHAISLMLYLPLFVQLISTDTLHTVGQSISVQVFQNTPLFLVIIILLCGITITLRSSLQREKHRQIEEFSDVERAYQYYVGIRADYENGADIRLNALGDMLQRRMDTYYRDERKMHLSINTFQGKADFLLCIFKCIQTLAIYGFILFKTLAGAIGIGGFYLYTNALSQGLESITEIIREYGEICIAEKYYKGYPRLWEMEKRSESTHDAAPQRPTQCGEGIVFSDVSFRYPGSENWVLRNVNLTIRPGEMVAIVGKNGMGKTTLIKLLMGLYQLSSGHIYVDGVDISRMSSQELFAKFSTVFQDYRILAASLAENVSSFEEKPDIRRVRQALKASGFNISSEQDLSRQLSRHLSEEGVLLSGGEEQKIAIARAIYKNAPYYIMDEPSAALDPIAEKEITEQMMKESHGHTLIVISHRLSTCSKAHRVIVLENGQIWEDGTHRELLEKGGLYARMWKAQAQNYTVIKKEDTAF